MVAPELNLFERIQARCTAASAPRFLDLGAGGLDLECDGAELIALSQRVASALRQLAPGAFVLLWLDRCSTFLPAFWGCLAAGKTALPIPLAAMAGRPSARDLEQLAQLLASLGPVAVVVDETSAAAQAWLPFDSSVQWLPWSSLVAAAPPALPSASPAELAFVLHTSGTTGDCKYAAFSPEWFDYEQSNNRRVLSLFPLGSSTGIGFGYGLNGLSAYLPLRQAMRDPDLLLAAIERHRLEVVVMPPVMVRALLRHFSEASAPLQSRDLSSLIRINIGSAAIPLAAVQQLNSLLQAWGAPTELIHFAYGLTETGGVAFGPFLGEAEHGHFAGLRIGPISPGVEVQIQTDDPLQPGLIQVRRAFTFLGYLQLDGPGAWHLERFKSGQQWFATGDLGWLDADGLVLGGRIKDTIVVNSRKLSLAQVECHLLSQWPDVLEEVVACAGPEEQLLVVAVPRTAVGLPVEQLEPVMAAELQRQFGLPLAALQLVEADTLPRTSTGKIQKRKLVEAWLAEPPAVGAGRAPAAGVLALLMDELRARASVFRPEDPGQRLSLFGIDSLALAQIIGSLERRTGSRCALEACPPDPQVRELAALFQPAAQASSGLMADLTRYPQRQAIAQQIRAANLTMPVAAVGPDSVVHLFQASALGQPLVLVGRLSSSFVQRLAMLLPDHPLYYLRVLHDYGTAANHAYLASCYVDWLEAALPPCEPILVGFCLAGVLALDVARQLWSRPHRPRLTVLMDWTVGRDRHPDPYLGTCAYHIHERYLGNDPQQRHGIEANLRERTPNTPLIYWAAARQQVPNQSIDLEATATILGRILQHPHLQPLLER